MALAPVWLALGSSGATLGMWACAPLTEGAAQICEAAKVETGGGCCGAGSAAVQPAAVLPEAQGAGCCETAPAEIGAGAGEACGLCAGAEIAMAKATSLQRACCVNSSRADDSVAQAGAQACGSSCEDREGCCSDGACPCACVFCGAVFLATTADLELTEPPYTSLAETDETSSSRIMEVHSPPPQADLSRTALA